MRISDVQNTLTIGPTTTTNRLTFNIVKEKAKRSLTRFLTINCEATTAKKSEMSKMLNKMDENNQRLGRNEIG